MHFPFPLQCSDVIAKLAIFFEVFQGCPRLWLFVYAVGLFLGETSKSIFGGESSWNDGKISDKVVIDEETEIRIIRKGVARYERLK